LHILSFLNGTGRVVNQHFGPPVSVCWLRRNLVTMHALITSLTAVEAMCFFDNH